MIPKIIMISLLTYLETKKIKAHFLYHLFSNSSFPSSILVFGMVDDPSVSEFWHFLGLILPDDELEL